MTLQEMWDKCRERARQGRDVNGGGLGRLKVAGHTYVGGFFLNLIMLYSPETGGLVKAHCNSPSIPAPEVVLQAEEYCNYLKK